MEVVLSLNGFVRTVDISVPHNTIRYCVNRPLRARTFEPFSQVEVDVINIDFVHEHGNLFHADIHEIVDTHHAENWRDRHINKLLSKICGLEREIRRLKNERRKT